MNGSALAQHLRHGWRHRATRRTLGRVLVLSFIALVAWLVIDHARKVDWAGVRDAIAAYPLGTLAAALALVVASHLTYSTYELLGRRYVGHHLATPTSLGVGLVSYAFNLNLGSLVGGVGFRLRLYSRLGLHKGQIGRLIGFSMVTNWSGYLLLAGLVLAARTIELPDPVALGTGVLQVLGIAMVGLAIAYVALCARSKRRRWTVRGVAFVLPSARMALAQIGISGLNWALIGATVWTLMPPGVGYGISLGTLLAAAVVAVPTHVPGGLGVLEAVFVGVLAGQVPESPLIAALLVYRALYYLLPLGVAAVLYLGFEAGTRRRRHAREAR